MSLGSSNAAARKRYKYNITLNKPYIDVLYNDTFFTIDNKKKVDIQYGHWVEADSEHKIGFVNLNSPTLEIEYNDTNFLNATFDEVSHTGPNINSARLFAGGGNCSVSNIFGGNDNITTEKFDGTTWQMSISMTQRHRYMAASTGTSGSAIVTSGSGDYSTSPFFRNSIEICNNITWSITSDILLSSVCSHSMAGFATNDCCMLNGNIERYTGSYSHSMTKFNGTSWSIGPEVPALFQLLSSTGHMSNIIMTSGGLPTSDIFFYPDIIYTIKSFNTNTYKFDGTTWSTSGHMMNKNRLAANLIGQSANCMLTGGYILGDKQYSSSSFYYSKEIPEIEYYNGVSWRVGNNLIVPKFATSSFNQNNVNTIKKDVIIAAGSFRFPDNYTNSTEVIETLGTRTFIILDSSLNYIDTSNFMVDSGGTWELISTPNVSGRLQYNIFGTPSSAVICAGHIDAVSFMGGINSSEIYNGVSWSVGPKMYYPRYDATAIGTSEYGIIIGGFAGGNNAYTIEVYKNNTFSFYMNYERDQMGARAIGTTSYFIVFTGKRNDHIYSCNSSMVMKTLLSKSIMESCDYCISGTVNYAMMTKGSEIYGIGDHCYTYIWNGDTIYLGTNSLTVASFLPYGGSSGDNLMCVADDVTETFNGEIFKVDSFTGFRATNGAGVGTIDNYLFAGAKVDSGTNYSRKRTKYYKSDDTICTLYTNKPVEVY